MRHTILLVDDDPAHLQIYAGVLKQAGYRPITALIGKSGVSFPEHEIPTLVLMDYRFNSGLGPRDIASLIRGRYPQATLILLSSLPDLPADMGDLVHGFIQKRDPEYVLAAVQVWLQRSAAANKS